MLGETWLYTILLPLLLVHLLTIAYVYLRTERGIDARSERSDGGRGVTGDAVECPRCGSTNEAGYRYCRACVGELPGVVDRTGSGLAPTGRRIG